MKIQRKQKGISSRKRGRGGDYESEGDDEEDD